MKENLIEVQLADAGMRNKLIENLLTGTGKGQIFLEYLLRDCDITNCSGVHVG